jgi:hypothetical protein
LGEFKMSGANKGVTFTHDQEEFICFQIGEWYLRWKDKITDNETHRLGLAKEELKKMLCTSTWEEIDGKKFV